MQGHHGDTWGYSSLTEPRVHIKVSAVSSYCPPITAMAKSTIQIIQTRRPQKRLQGKHAAAWIAWVHTPTKAASNDNVCRQSLSQRGSHTPNGHKLLPFTLCPEAQQNQTGLRATFPGQCQLSSAASPLQPISIVTWVLVSALLLVLYVTQTRCPPPWLHVPFY